MEVTPAAERRRSAERRAPADRRRLVELVPVERRAAGERRSGVDRRAPDNMGECIRSALQLLTNVAESGVLDEENLRDLDSAMFRLRFALERFDTRR
jgi:hypothetical protein